MNLQKQEKWNTLNQIHFKHSWIHIILFEYINIHSHNYDCNIKNETLKLPLECLLQVWGPPLSVDNINSCIKDLSMCGEMDRL